MPKGGTRREIGGRIRGAYAPVGVKIQLPVGENILAFGFQPDPMSGRIKLTLIFCFASQAE